MLIDAFLVDTLEEISYQPLTTFCEVRWLDGVKLELNNG